MTVDMHQIGGPWQRNAWALEAASDVEILTEAWQRYCGKYTGDSQRRYGAYFRAAMQAQKEHAYWSALVAEDVAAWFDGSAFVREADSATRTS